MLKVVEAFSGIGSQAKALSNLGIDFKIVNTIEWDIYAFLAYDIIHNGAQNNKEYEDIHTEELRNILGKYSISTNGKEPMNKVTFSNLKREIMIKILSAIKRTNNLVSITDVSANMFDTNIDLFTYSFPCQDLSISGNWHGNEGGIDRDSGNRSSMLWEVERLLLEMNSNGYSLPKFLLMENVSSIRSSRHIDNFMEWKNNLNKLGYKNRVYDLSSSDFGVPQRRKRTFMISVLTKNDEDKNSVLDGYWFSNNLENIVLPLNPIEDYLRLDYTKPCIMKEAIESIPNDTESRRKIKKENPLIVENKMIKTDTVRTITTKQDRNPNSGVIEHNLFIEGKSDFRYLTPRECFLMMGFSEQDYERLLTHNFESRKNSEFFSTSRLIKLAGNSIVVDVMEAVLKQILEIKELLRF